jgi:hypothetical protein
MPRCSVRAIAYFSSLDRRPRECVAMRNGIRQVKMSPRHSSGTQASSSRCPVAAKPPLARQPAPREALSLSDGCVNHCAEQFPVLQPFAWRLHHVTTNEHFLLGIDPERSAVCTTPAVVANGTSDGLAPLQYGRQNRDRISRRARASRRDRGELRLPYGRLRSYTQSFEHQDSACHRECRYSQPFAGSVHNRWPCSAARRHQMHICRRFEDHSLAPAPIARSLANGSAKRPCLLGSTDERFAGCIFVYPNPSQVIGKASPGQAGHHPATARVPYWAGAFVMSDAFG